MLSAPLTGDEFRMKIFGNSVLIKNIATFELFLIRRYTGLHAQGFRVSIKELGSTLDWSEN